MRAAQWKTGETACSYVWRHLVMLKPWSETLDTSSRTISFCFRGLITFRESYLLADPQTAGLQEQLGVASIIAHETAHMVKIRAGCCMV